MRASFIRRLMKGKRTLTSIPSFVIETIHWALINATIPLPTTLPKHTHPRTPKSTELIVLFPSDPRQFIMISLCLKPEIPRTGVTRSLCCC